MYYIHKHDVGQQFGGSEEGGWWYTAGSPVDDWKPPHFYSEETANARCRQLNEEEHERRKVEERYDFTSVLSYRSTFYEYSVHESPNMEHFPKTRPHYE